MATTTEPRKSISIKKPGSPHRETIITTAYITALVVVGVLAIVVAAYNFYDMSQHVAEPSKEALPAEQPSAFWLSQAVQNDGRHKGFQIACAEIALNLHGRMHIFGQEPASVVLMWMMESNPDAATPKGQWDKVAFLLCENRDLREFIYTLGPNGTFGSEEELTPVQKLGKYISPHDVVTFKKRMHELRDVNPRQFREKYSRLEKEINPLLGRLNLYQRLRKQHIPKEEAGAYNSVLHFAALDSVRGSSWFSIDEMRLINDHPGTWHQLLLQRVRKSPGLYLSDTHKQALAAFQTRVKNGEGEQAVDEIQGLLDKHRDERVATYKKLREEAESAKDEKVKREKKEKAAEIVLHAIRTWPSVDDEKKAGKRLLELMPPLAKKKRDFEEEYLKKHGRRVAVNGQHFLFQEYKQEYLPLIITTLEQTIVEDAAMLRAVLVDRDKAMLANLKDQLPNPSEYYSFHDKWRMLHMSYLEVRFPNLYQDVVGWQKAPVNEIKQILTAYDNAGKAYRKGDAQAFEAKSKTFFDVVHKISRELPKKYDDPERPYPGEASVSDRFVNLVTGSSVAPPSQWLIDMELTYYNVRPFMWAWIIMLGAVICFIFSLGFNSRIMYILAFACVGVSLLFQSYGFFVRVVLSGRPPVRTLYETVIWVSFMCTVFSLILELIYRRKVIALAGALVATLGMVLADQLPVALDPGIKPLLPVLRSNFWLTIHVLTIVSSYGAGSLAWGLGNISLILIVFGKGTRETVKLLSNFTYRVLQIAVILLAVGTFLGGWWAAYSWGRFWGWDPKENGALMALLCYVIPLHMRYAGWLKDFGLAVASILCYASVLISWYGINFLWPGGLHAYGFSSGGAGWVYMACLLNIEWVLIASWMYRQKQIQATAGVGDD